MAVVAAFDADRAKRARIAMQFSSASILPYVAFNKDAFPQPPAHKLAGPNHSACRNRLILLRILQRNDQGFRSLCGHRRRST
jgi:hypothetical protein